MPVPILKQGKCLVASIQSTLTDADWRELLRELLEQIGRYRTRGVLVDVTALDVLDSYATRTLRTIVDTTRLRGADTVLIGIQPEVALAMVRLGLTARFQDVATALDLEEGLALVMAERTSKGGDGRDH
jgi:rsbT antagonist protein RsbS